MMPLDTDVYPIKRDEYQAFPNWASQVTVQATRMRRRKGQLIGSTRVIATMPASEAEELGKALLKAAAELRRLRGEVPADD
jgi:hypothetical protein